MPKRRGEPGPATDQAPGAFRADGSFDQAGGWAQQGPMHALVVSLVRQRRAGSLAISEAVAQVRAARGEAAFPCLDQWGSSALWSCCRTETSAEEAVKRCGASSSDGHWCGQVWTMGSEKDCQAAKHGALPTKNETAVLVAGVVKALSVPASGQSTRDAAPSSGDAEKAQPGPTVDESWFDERGWGP